MGLLINITSTITILELFAVVIEFVVVVMVVVAELHAALVVVLDVATSSVMVVLGDYSM